MAENFRPEDMPRHFGLTLREQYGLLLETSRNRTPPCSYYKVIRLIYIYQGILSCYSHWELCGTAHQACAYRHRPSDQFLRMASMCCECVFCPTFIIEHHHRPSKPCSQNCDIRPVYKPRNQTLTPRPHDCRTHIDHFPPYFVRRMLLNYPTMPFSPFFATSDDYRISASILENGLKGIERWISKQKFEPEIDMNISLLFF